ncbi:MAG: type II secretion system F family protein [Acidobacteria bacterium]|nr:type II secretion system F family protein [Acidobacteriota bacterium]MCW5971041.1 type II secretion system F family protein [Blastocatellales bacterium]
MIPFLVFLSCLVVTMLTYWILSRKAASEQKMLQARINEALLFSPQSKSTGGMNLSRNDLLSEIPTFNQWLQEVQGALRLKHILEQADLDWTVMRLWMFSALAGLLSGMVASLLAGSLLPAVLVGLAAASLPFVYVMRRRTARLHAFLSRLPDTLELMSRSLQAGHAFTESLHMVAGEMPEPISSEFRKTYEEQNLGLPLKLALKNLTERIPLLELRLCVTAILIQRETGGNLAEILDKVAYTIRERFRIMEDLNTLTTSSRMSAWVLCALPVGIAVMIQVLNPQYMEILWTDPRGQRLVYIAAGMQLTGMLIIRKIMRIKI